MTDTSLGVHEQSEEDIAKTTTKTTHQVNKAERTKQDNITRSERLQKQSYAGSDKNRNKKAKQRLPS